jgi:predicted transcriptional regulator
MMKSFIPKQPKQVRERIEAKLDERLVRRLEQYCRYLESDREYVLAQALELIFRKDKGFVEWLSRQQPAVLTEPDAVTARRTQAKP